MTRIDSRYIRISDHSFQLNVYSENRRSIRYSIRRDKINLRLPLFLSKKQKEEQVLLCQDWVKKKLVQDSTLLPLFASIRIHNGTILELFDQEVKIEIEHSPGSTYFAFYSNKKISLEIDTNLPEVELQGEIRRLICGVLNKVYIETVRARVRILNERFFGYNYGHVRLKYNKSNWGSCSIKRNLNFSTRMLFLPQNIQDYIIIHELAHLDQMNHSEKFWKLVAGAYPDYQAAKRWIKQNGAQIPV